MVPVLIGLSIAAGAIFLLWMVMRGRQPSGAVTAPAQSKGFIDKLIGMGNSLASGIMSYGEQVANGAIGITDESVNRSASVLSKIVNTGGNLLTKGNQVGAQIASTTGSVVKGSITAPFAAIPPSATGAVKTAASTVVKYSDPRNVVKGVAGAASSAYSTISGWF